MVVIKTRSWVLTSEKWCILKYVSIQPLSIIISKNLYYYEKNEYTTNLIRRGKLKFQFQYQIGDKIIAEISSILFLC